LTCVITICAGALQILFGVIKVARAALGVAPVVVHAMLAGIGVTIVLQQIHVLMGGASRSSAAENIKALPSGVLHRELHEVIVGGLVIAILLLWPKLPEAPVTLYRGCAPERRFGMSWTTDLDRARWFAERDLSHGTGNVYVYQASPALVKPALGRPMF
jgi:MFS superfamily sulfate permease-like transporter